MNTDVRQQWRRWVAEPAGGVLWDEAAAGTVRRAGSDTAGGATEQEVDIIAFRQGPNRRSIRVRDEDLAGLAESFIGAPFLRDHDETHIDSRDGVVIASVVQTDADGVAAIRQRLRITTARGRQSLAQGQIDRFSVSFDVAGWTCSVCGKDWLHCEHLPGQEYGRPGELADNNRVTCELIAERPLGREVSAVNVPAVAGTGVCGCEQPPGLAAQLAALCASKRAQQASELRTGELVESVLQEREHEGGMMTDEVKQAAGAIRQNSTANGFAPTGANGTGEAGATLAALRAELAAVQTLRAELAAELAGEQREAALRASGLSEGGRQVVRLAAQAQDGGDQGRLNAAGLAALIEAQGAAEAALRGGSVRGNRAVAISGMKNEEDRGQEMMDWVMGLAAAPLPAPNLRSLRELYLAITGDYAFQGKLQPERAQFANATTSTLPALAANSLNKVILQHYEAMATWRWYEPLVAVVPHDGSTQPVQLVLVDGVANLSTVSEGDAYTELAVGDSKEALSFVKKGNYVGITLEMFRRSEIGKLQAMARAMALASLRTRSAAIAGIFTAASGVGPTLAEDSKALFHADHGNLDTTAFAAAAWAAARKRIWSQTVPGTSKKFGLWPTFCLLPIDLYDTALEAFGYGSGDVGKPNADGTAQSVNPYGGSRPGDPRPIPVAVPDWSDANDWAYLVDPRLQPVIHMAYANAPAGGSHPAPEFFTATNETQGLMFTNDTLAVKVRDWWGYGVAGYVGIGKNNVAA